MRQRRVAAGNGLSCVAAGSGLGAGLGTTITYVRPKLRPTNPPRRRCIAAWVTLPLCTRGWLYLPCSSAHLPGVLLLMRQRRVAAGNGRQRPKHRPENHDQVRAPLVFICRVLFSVLFTLFLCSSAERFSPDATAPCRRRQRS